MRNLVWLTLIAGSLCHAEAPTAKYLTLQKPKPVVLVNGKTANAIVAITVDKGFHVQANPASAANYIATTFEVAKKDGLEPGPTVYPPGKPYQLNGSPDSILTYDGKFELKVPVTAREAKPGKTTLEGKLRYQACSDKTCFFPITVPITIPVEVKKAG